MFPVSGAEQLNTSGARLDLPMTSHSDAYSRFVSPAPWSLSGRNRFHRPAARLAWINVLGHEGLKPRLIVSNPGGESKGYVLIYA